MAMFRAWAATQAGGPLQRMDFDPGTLHPEDVEIAVEHCGVCHSDLAMVDSEWFPASYPLVPGHEVVGTIVAVGDQAKGRSVGQRVGLGWHSHSCCHCNFCLGGDQNLVRQTPAHHHWAPWRLCRPGTRALELEPAHSSWPGSD